MSTTLSKVWIFSDNSSQKKKNQFPDSVKPHICVFGSCMIHLVLCQVNDTITVIM
jgi:hypothetical protein